MPQINKNTLADIVESVKLELDKGIKMIAHKETDAYVVITICDSGYCHEAVIQLDKFVLVFPDSDVSWYIRTETRKAINRIVEAMI